MEETNDIKIIKHDLEQQSILDIMRERSGMYMGSSSLTGLRFFLEGFRMAQHLHGMEAPPPLPRDFADWVAYRLHLNSNWDGFWHRAILSRIRDEYLALIRFYELRDEYLLRKPKVVATIRKDRREHRVGQRGPSREIIWRTELLPESLRVVVYTNDPGFFLIADEDDPFSYPNGWFFSAFDCSVMGWKVSAERFEIHDQSTWDRLVVENKKYKKNLARRRARIQRKAHETVTLENPSRQSNSVASTGRGPDLNLKIEAPPGI